MEERTQGIILTILIIVFIVLSGFLFSLTNITIDYFLTINLIPLAGGFLSIEFISFIITSSITLTLLIITISKFDTQEALIYSLTGYVIGILFILLIFIQLQFIFALLFAGFGLALSIKMFENNDETLSKRFKSGSAVTGKLILFFGVGIFITVLLITLPNANEYEKNFSQDFVKSIIGGDDGGIGAPLLSSIGELQKETLNSLQQTTEYKKMQTLNDSDFLRLDNKVNDLKLFYTSKEYQEILANGTNDILTSSDPNQNTTINLPFVNDLAKYAWLVYALLAFVSVIFIGEVILKNISAILYALVSKPKI